MQTIEVPLSRPRRKRRQRKRHHKLRPLDGLQSTSDSEHEAESDLDDHVLHTWVNNTRNQVQSQANTADYESFLFVACPNEEAPATLTMEGAKDLMTCETCAMRRHMCKCVDLCCLGRSESGSAFVAFLGRVFTAVQDTEGCL
jgi:hypothetical protein